MVSSNHGCYPVAKTPALHMVYTPPPLQTALLSFDTVPSCPDFEDLFPSSDFGFGDSVTQPELLPTMDSQFQPDSSFSPLPTTSTNTHATQNKEAPKQSQKEEEEEEEEEVIFIVEGDADALNDGYSWRKNNEKSIKHRYFCRSYYRCGHDGCKVKKQVEHSTANPAAYLITYYGYHNHYGDTSFHRIQ